MRIAVALALVLYAATSAFAQEPKSQGPDQARTPGGSVLALLPKDAVTEHTLSINGAPLAYTATAGTLDLFGQNGERSAAVFYTA